MAVVLHHHRRRSPRRRRRRPFLFLLAAFFFLLASAISTRPTPLDGKGKTERTELAGGAEERVVTRRRLGGPGSSPPTCRSKCGSCSPCTAVHVPIQPGLSLPLEYYPEAWRCKCGNSLYMP